MGISNRQAALERKIALLSGDREQQQERIANIEAAAATVPSIKERIAEIDHLIAACETVIMSDHPKWTREGVQPIRPFTHKIPVELGSATKLADAVLRTAHKPLTGRKIAIEVLRRSGQVDCRGDTITRLRTQSGTASVSANETDSSKMTANGQSAGGRSNLFNRFGLRVVATLPAQV